MHSSILISNTKMPFTPFFFYRLLIDLFHYLPYQLTDSSFQVALLFSERNLLGGIAEKPSNTDKISKHFNRISPPSILLS